MYKKIILGGLIAVSALPTFAADENELIVSGVNTDEVMALALKKQPTTVVKASREVDGSIVKFTATVDRQINGELYTLYDDTGYVFAHINQNLYPYGRLYRGVRVRIIGKVYTLKTKPKHIQVVSIQIIG
ncbi:hypothetical protein GCM10027155_03000 [Acinetobacter apis]|uniref:TIGR00156 family protein n=1 Tax=Acinetobacter apis TaxID=1229165 RepID=A0A217ED00_9GAMM|nr:NirD/YgiW/YdeI family stress tolerance protein [Acinetobacter apis]SNQ28385.1 hypothetical protein SAMN05444584_0304 [Acinetobacter apis]